MTSDPDRSDGIDTAGSAAPPYEGRRESADIKDKQEAVKDGAKVGGAASPVENDEMASPAPEDTLRGATGSPADELPASGAPETAPDDDGVGPAHQAGTPRGEGQS